MKKIISLILVITFIFTLIPAVSANTPADINIMATEREQIWAVVEKLIYEYSPAGQYILESSFERTKGTTSTRIYNSKTDTFTIETLRDLITLWDMTGTGDVFTLLDTTVHEEYHRIQFYGQYYGHLVDNDIVRVDYMSSGLDLIKTEEATGNLPENLRTQRWRTYASQGAATSSNTRGVYGLLNELSAYYYGNKAIFDCYEILISYLEKNGYSEELGDLVLNYINSLYNNMQAFYEFTFWTIHYMLYLQENYPALYSSVMDNKNYRTVFKYFYDNFEKSANDMPKKIENILESLANNGFNISADSASINFRIASGRSKGVVIDSFIREINILKTELNKEKYVKMLVELLDRDITQTQITSEPTAEPAPVTESELIITQPEIIEFIIIDEPEPEIILEPEPAAEPQTARPASATVLINGENAAFDAYNIAGNNYFKLRDLAFVLSGTEKQFNVGWDRENNAIALTSGEAYGIVGGEMEPSTTAGNRTAAPTTSGIYLDGELADFTAYLIGGNNYFKLRDIMEAFDVYVGWDGESNTITLDTSMGYKS